MFGQYFGAGYFGDGYWGPSSGAAPVVVVADTSGAGNIDWLKRRKRRLLLKRSELQAHEARAAALAAALAEKSIPLDELGEDEEFRDDEILVKALAVTMTTLQ